MYIGQHDHRIPINNTLRQPPSLDHNAQPSIDHTTKFSIGDKIIFTLYSKLLTLSILKFTKVYIGKGLLNFITPQWQHLHFNQTIDIYIPIQ